MYKIFFKRKNINKSKFVSIILRAWSIYKHKRSSPPFIIRISLPKSEPIISYSFFNTWLFTTPRKFWRASNILFLSWTSSLSAWNRDATYLLVTALSTLIGSARPLILWLLMSNLPSSEPSLSLLINFEHIIIKNFGCNEVTFIFFLTWISWVSYI